MLKFESSSGKNINFITGKIFGMVHKFANSQKKRSTTFREVWQTQRHLGVKKLVLII